MHEQNKTFVFCYCYSLRYSNIILRFKILELLLKNNLSTSKLTNLL